MEELDLVNISTEELVEIYKLIEAFINNIDKEIKSLEVKKDEK